MTSPNDNQSEISLQRQNTIVLTDFSSIHDQVATQYAERQLAHRIQSGGGGRVKRFFREAWFNNIYREVFIEKHKSIYGEGVKEDGIGSLYTGLLIDQRSLEDDATDSSKQEAQADSKRAVEVAIAQSASVALGLRKSLNLGSSTENLVKQLDVDSDEVSEAGKDFAEKLRTKVSGIVTARIDVDNPMDDATYEAKKEELNQLVAQASLLQNKLGVEPGLIGINIDQIVAEFEGLKNHEDGLNAALESLKQADIRLAEADPAVSTESYKTATSKFAKKIKANRWFNGLTTTAITAGIAVGTNVLRASANTAASLAVVGGGIVGIGAIQGLRRRYVVQREAQQARREFVTGGDLTADPNANKYSQFQYESKHASELLIALDDLLPGSSATTEQFDDTWKANSVKLLAEIKERLSISTSNNTDLIVYDDVARASEQKQALIDKANYLETLLLFDTSFSDNNDTKELKELDDEFILSLGDGIYEEPRKIKDHLNLKMQEILAQILGDMQSKDEEYKKFRNRESFKAGLQAAAVAGTLSIGASALATVIDGLRNVTDNINQDTSGSPAENGADNTGELFTLDNQSIEFSDIEYSTSEFGDVLIDTPSGLVVEERSGEFVILNESGDVIGTIEIDDSGVPTQQSIDELKAKGIDINYAISENSQEVVVGAKEYLASNPNDIIDISTVEWLDNGTPNVYEGDELALHQGGSDGTWLDNQGNVVVDVSNMVNSSPDNISITAMLGDNSGWTFDVQDGIATIPKDHPAASLFTAETFSGGIIQANVVTDIAANGDIQVSTAASFVGTDSAQIQTNITTTEVSIKLEPVSLDDYNSAIRAEAETPDFVSVLPEEADSSSIETEQTESSGSRSYNFDFASNLVVLPGVAAYKGLGAIKHNRANSTTNAPSGGSPSGKKDSATKQKSKSNNSGETPSSTKESPEDQANKEAAMGKLRKLFVGGFILDKASNQYFRIVGLPKNQDKVPMSAEVKLLRVGISQKGQLSTGEVDTISNSVLLKALSANQIVLFRSLQHLYSDEYSATEALQRPQELEGQEGTIWYFETEEHKPGFYEYEGFINGRHQFTRSRYEPFERGATKIEQKGKRAHRLGDKLLKQAIDRHSIKRVLTRQESKQRDKLSQELEHIKPGSEIILRDGNSLIVVSIDDDKVTLKENNQDKKEHSGEINKLYELIGDGNIVAIKHPSKKGATLSKTTGKKGGSKETSDKESGDKTKEQDATGQEEEPSGAENDNNSNPKTLLKRFIKITKTGEVFQITGYQPEQEQYVVVSQSNTADTSEQITSVKVLKEAIADGRIEFVEEPKVSDPNEEEPAYVKQIDSWEQGTIVIINDEEFVYQSWLEPGNPSAGIELVDNENTKVVFSASQIEEAINNNKISIKK